MTRATRDAADPHRYLGGMGYSNLVALAIVIGTAATLHAHGITDIATAAGRRGGTAPDCRASSPRRCSLPEFSAPGCWRCRCWLGRPPMRWARRSAGRSVSSRRPCEARAFYATMAGATLLGAGIVFSPIEPMKALFWSRGDQRRGGRPVDCCDGGAWFVALGDGQSGAADLAALAWLGERGADDGRDGGDVLGLAQLAVEASEVQRCCQAPMDLARLGRTMGEGGSSWQR